MNWLENFFYFHKREKRALYIIWFLILGSLMVKIFYHQIFPYQIDVARLDSTLIGLQMPPVDTSRIVNLVNEAIPPIETQKLEEVKTYFHQPVSVEINSTDSAGLAKIYYLPFFLINRIIKYRELLGGYYRKEQLLEVYGMDSSLYEKVKPRITVDTLLVKKIDLQIITFRELLKHPYFTYDEVLIIFKIKNRNSDSITFNMIREARVFPPEKLNKVKWYLQ